MAIFKEINLLLNYALKNNLIEKYDEIVARNEILFLLKLNEWVFVEIDSQSIPEFPTEILSKISDYAVKKCIIQDTLNSRELFDTQLMGILTPKPTQVIENFYNLKKSQSVNKATEFYYIFSQKTNYIRTDRTKKNKHWKSSTKYGDIEITINLSKPEKDPKDIAAAKLIKPSSYPKCLLCYENVGYFGNSTLPARQNHRVIPISLVNEEWFFQYSPYVYYNEHAIVFSKEHKDMKINSLTFERLLNFVEQFPHYFIGSNADLPIVGGSILTHEHYQSGCYEFPMAKASFENEIKFKGFDDIKCGILNWPLSVIRIIGKNKEELLSLANKILNSWKNYSDEKLNIISYTDVPHNTITPIARKRNNNFELDLVLRNNRTTENYPFGIFHPHEKLHNIKKENIGLIEVMGLAILPGRLKKELEILGDSLLEPDFENKIKNNQEVKKHLNWGVDILKKYKNITSENVQEILKKEVGSTFTEVLENAGVFKKNDLGKAGFSKFINYINSI